MRNQYYSFYYDPVRQGYDPLSWSSLFGTPTINGNQLSVSDSAIVHLADILRGDAIFNITTPAPIVGFDKTFGLIQYSKNEYIYFRILDDTLTANTSDGTTAYSVNITWDTNWSNVNTEFRIKWEAGQAQFFIGGVQKTIISQSYLLDIPVSAIPGDPMSLYLSDFSLNNQILLNYIDVKGIQSYILNTGASSGTIINHPIQKLEKLTISDVVTVSPATTTSINIFDTITSSEIISQVGDVVEIILIININDTINTSENITVNNPELLFSINNFDILTVSESITQNEV